MPRRTQLDGCELHPSEDGYRVCHGSQLLGWACRPTTGKPSRWNVRDAHGLELLSNDIRNGSFRIFGAGRLHRRGRMST